MIRKACRALDILGPDRWKVRDEGGTSQPNETNTFLTEKYDAFCCCHRLSWSPHLLEHGAGQVRDERLGLLALVGWVTKAAPAAHSYQIQRSVQSKHWLGLWYDCRSNQILRFDVSTRRRADPLARN